MELALIIIGALLLGALFLAAVFIFRQRLAPLLFKAPYIGPRMQRRAVQEISADPEKMLASLPAEFSNQQQQAIEKALKGRRPEEIEQLMNKALSGQQLRPEDLQRPVGSGKMNQKKVSQRRKKNKQARKQRQKGRK